jgi:hypothetical protein
MQVVWIFGTGPPDAWLARANSQKRLDCGACSDDSCACVWDAALDARRALGRSGTFNVHWTGMSGET